MTEPTWAFHCADFANERAGLNIESRIGPLPRSSRDAAELYQRLGVTCLGDLMSKLFEEVPTRKAMRGDVVMVDGALGVCRGEWAEFMDNMQPMRRATRAWSVKAGLNLANELSVRTENRVDSVNGDAALST